MHALTLFGLVIGVLAAMGIVACGGDGLGWLLNPGGGSTSPDVPNPGNVGADYYNLVQGYTKGVPLLLDAERKYKPGFVDTALGSTDQTLFGTDKEPGLLTDYERALGPLSEAEREQNAITRAANVGDVGYFGGAAGRAVGSINPGQTRLLETMTTRAQEGMDAGTRLLPGDVDAITSQVRGDWASRGMGTSAPAALDEALQLYGGGEQALARRQAVASQAAQADQMITLPALSLVTGQSNVPQQGQSFVTTGAGFGQQAGPTVVPANQSYDVFNTAYNARAAANIASANNQAALDAY